MNKRECYSSERTTASVAYILSMTENAHNSPHFRGNAFARSAAVCTNLNSRGVLFEVTAFVVFLSSCFFTRHRKKSLRGVQELSYLLKSIGTCCTTAKYHPQLRIPSLYLSSLQTPARVTIIPPYLVWGTRLYLMPSASMSVSPTVARLSRVSASSSAATMR